MISEDHDATIQLLRHRVEELESALARAGRSADAAETARQTRLVQGLRKINEFVQALEHASNISELCREAILFARNELGAQRCGLFLVEKDGIRGTWGTDRVLNLVREDHIFITHEQYGRVWGGSSPADTQRWKIHHGDLHEWRDGKAINIGEGWRARTAIHSRGKLIGVLFNDNFGSGHPPDEVMQETLLVFGGLVGQMVEVLTAREDLQRREAEFRLVVDHLPDIVERFDREGRVVFVSHQIETIMGLKPEAILGRRIRELPLPADLIDACERQLAEVFQTGTPRIFEFELPLDTGSVRLLARLIPEFRDDSSSPASALGVLSDVTEQRRAEEALIENERRYRRAIARAGLIPYERQLDRDDYHYISNEIEQLMGIPATEMRLSRLQGLILETRLRGKLADMNLEEAVRKVRAGEINEWSADIRIRNRHGREIWLADHAVMSWDEQSKGYWVLGFLQDITERVRVESDLLTSQRRLGLLHRVARSIHGDLSLKEVLGQVLTELREYLPDYRISYSRLEKEGRLEVLCSRQPPSMPSTEGTVRDCSQVLPELGYVFDLLPTAVNDGLDSTSSEQFRRLAMPGDARAWLSIPIPHDENSYGLLTVVSPRPHVWEENELQTMLEIADYLRLLVRDSLMRERREASERALQAGRELLLQSQKMDAIARLAGGIAHDFNNLLTVIAGNVELIADDLAAEKREVEGIDDVRNAVARATSLTSQLLNYGRRQFVQPVVFRLEERFDMLDRLLRRSIREDIDYHVDLEKGVWPIFADPGQIEQMIVNLVVNSCEAMPRGGRLTVSAHNVVLDVEESRQWQGIHPGRHVMVCVTDTGLGIRPDAMGKLFEPFYSTKDSPAAGLGLASVFGIVKKFEGDIRAESEPSKGATFRILFPAHEMATPPATESREQRDPCGEETILVVEDEASLLAMASRTLRSYGYRVLEANAGEEAIGVFDAHEAEIALLVTDVVMPGMSGPELAAELARRRPNLPILYISGYSDEEIVRRGIERGKMNFLGKPFNPRALGERIRAILDETTAQSR